MRIAALRYRLAALRLLLLTVVVLGSWHPSRAQRLLDFPYADSITQHFFYQQRWGALDSVGQLALRLGTDYPALRRRLGAGALATGHPAAALRYYEPALQQNPLDAAARSGLVAAYQALNQVGPAALLAHELPDSARQALPTLAPRALTQLELEASTLQTAEPRREAGTYGRIGIGSRLTSRLHLAQDFSYYGQTVELPRTGTAGAVERRHLSQGQYHVLLTGQVTTHWQVKAGYNYITKDLGHNHLGYAAFAYLRPTWTLQAGLYAGLVTDTARTQADVRLTFYPLGNLRLYGFGRGSFVQSTSRTYPNALLGVGGQLQPWLWAEAWASTGTVPVLAEADGTYLYNLLDPLHRRAAASLLILAPYRLSLRLVYGVEQRHIAPLGVDYTIHSFSVALACTW